MFKTLRKKFILITLLVSSAVLLLLLGFYLFSTYRWERTQIDESLDRVLSMTGERFDAAFPTNNAPVPEGGFAPIENKDQKTEPSREDFPQMGKDEMPQIYAYAVTVDKNGDVQYKFALNSGMDEGTLVSSVRLAMQTDKKSGKLKSQDLFYKKETRGDNTVIAFTDATALEGKMKSSVLLALAVFLIGLALVFLASYYLSGVALKPAKEAWESQKRFVADASHDLKTPLTVILANNNILRSHGDDTVKSQQKWIDSTEEEAHLMKKLAENLVELSRSDALTEKIEFSDMDVSSAVEEVCMQMELIAFEAGVKFDTQITAGIYRPSNPDLLSRLCHILIDNAVKYATGADKTVKITLTPRKSTAVLTVFNSGAYITPEQRAHIFDRFYRADTARSIGGHGLGLPIAQNICQALNGKISVKSTEGVGTEFTVTFS